MMTLIFAYTNVYIKELIRDRAAAFFTLLFPVILLVCFGNKGATSATDRVITYIIYCHYAVQTVMFQALGITIAAARANPWTTYIKTLPFSAFPMLVGRILSNLLFALFSLSTIIVVTLFQHNVNLSLQAHFFIILCALLGAIPLALLAIFLGRLLTLAAAKSAFLLLNLLLLFATFTLSTPGILGVLQKFIFSYQWLMLSFSLISHQAIFNHFIWLIGFALLFYSLVKVSEKFI